MNIHLQLGTAMKKTVRGGTIELAIGDITLQEVDAIVNAANSRLAGGGGVDGAIHRRGGPAIMQETSRKYPQGCPTGSAVISGAGNLKSKYVIHAVGPFYRDGQSRDEQLLAGACRTSLELAKEHACASVAFPAISTGAYRYPLDEAAHIAVRAAAAFLADPGSVRLVRFVLFSQEAYDAFAKALAALEAGE
jgi:O-acetyl-ADP-ribose deacetylase (regulator of RNase III)